MRSLITTNADTVILSAASNATQVLTASGNSNLALSSTTLTLLRSASGTALLVNLGTGLVTGVTGATLPQHLQLRLRPWITTAAPRCSATTKAGWPAPATITFKDVHRLTTPDVMAM